MRTVSACVRGRGGGVAGRSRRAWVGKAGRGKKREGGERVGVRLWRRGGVGPKADWHGGRGAGDAGLSCCAAGADGSQLRRALARSCRRAGGAGWQAQRCAVNLSTTRPSCSGANASRRRGRAAGAAVRRHSRHLVLKLVALCPRPRHAGQARQERVRQRLQRRGRVQLRHRRVPVPQRYLRRGAGWAWGAGPERAVSSGDARLCTHEQAAGRLRSWSLRTCTVLAASRHAPIQGLAATTAASGPPARAPTASPAATIRPACRWCVPPLGLASGRQTLGPGHALAQPWAHGAPRRHTPPLRESRRLAHAVWMMLPADHVMASRDDGGCSTTWTRPTTTGTSMPPGGPPRAAQARRAAWRQKGPHSSRPRGRRHVKRAAQGEPRGQLDRARSSWLCPSRSGWCGTCSFRPPALHRRCAQVTATRATPGASAATTRRMAVCRRRPAAPPTRRRCGRAGPCTMGARPAR